MFFCEYILEICRNWLLATGQQYCFGTMMEVFLQTIPTTLLNRTPTSTLHRVFHLSRTTTKMMTIRLNRLTLHHHHHTFQTFLCQMNRRIRRIPAFLLMMISFTHHSIHHHDQVMIHQMMKCIHHKMNHLMYHNIHHHHRIILNHHFLEPLALLCPIRFYTTKHWRHTNDTGYQATTWWSTDTTCN